MPRRLSKNDTKAPPAPTTSQPPGGFSFGAHSPSPQREPIYASPKDTFTLNTLPPKKRPRRAETEKEEPKPPPEKKAEPIQLHQFKCPLPDCQFAVEGFETEQLRDAHSKDVHEFTGDSLVWCLDNMRKVLGLDKRAPTPATSAPDDPWAKSHAPLEAINQVFSFDLVPRFSVYSPPPTPEPLGEVVENEKWWDCSDWKDEDWEPVKYPGRKMPWWMEPSEDAKFVDIYNRMGKATGSYLPTPE